MDSIADTPEPPYYAVIFTSLRTAQEPEAYAAMAAEMHALAEQQPGFLGVESAREGLGITVSYIGATRPRSWPGSELPIIWQRSALAARAGMRPMRCAWPVSSAPTTSRRIRTPTMELAEIVPWGRSFDEYWAMFALSDADLGGHLLGCGDGPAAFNAEASARGADVVSVDPIYAFDAEVIAERIAAVRPQIEAGLRAAPERYRWEHFADVDALVGTRLAAMERFLADYPGPGASPRYIDAALPNLPFDDGAFDLALVSHLLFTYSEHLGADGHRDGLSELLRVSREVRLFPLVALDGEPSPHVEPVIAQAQAAGWKADIVPVDYAFQRGADRMLRLRPRD